MRVVALIAILGLNPRTTRATGAFEEGITLMARISATPPSPA